jgi:hypothetical protein
MFSAQEPGSSATVPVVAQILIEENFNHIDGQDMEELLEALTGLGLDAEPTQPRTPTGHGRGWVLVLHWLRDEPQHIMEDGFAAALTDAVHRVFGERRTPGLAPGLPRALPTRIDIHGRSGAVIRSIDVG